MRERKRDRAREKEIGRAREKESQREKEWERRRERSPFHEITPSSRVRASERVSLHKKSRR